MKLSLITGHNPALLLNTRSPVRAGSKKGWKMVIRKKKINIVFAFLFALSAILTAPPLYPQTGILLPHKGMCYVAWDKDRFASSYSDKSLEKLANLGVEYISIIVTLYQEEHDSTEIKRTERTPSDRSIAHAIKTAHKLGLKVMLKPHLDLIDKYDGTYCRSDIGFADDKAWKKWFKEYKKFILHYARMAKRFDVEIFCVGTELSFATQKNSAWQNGILPAVRKAYPGKLVYAANWDNYKNIMFWKDLDYIGIDAYFPLTYKTDPTVEDLKKGWEKWIFEIEAWRTSINKPVIFTEIGYPCTKHAPCMPWKGGNEGNAAPDIQAKCYEAFFGSVWKRPWLAGVYWWKWDTNIHSGGINNRRFTPQNKPAEKIIELHYKGYPRNCTFAGVERSGRSDG
ncbi:MAG: hypothetical protein U9R44_05850 [Candidatus Omnitrophota bacterium]|nr:hypothetical protein [Candidatus Omnitrophota bacterium]